MQCRWNDPRFESRPKKIKPELFFVVSGRKNFHLINASFVDPLVLEAVDVDDLESIEGNPAAAGDFYTEVELHMLG